MSDKRMAGIVDAFGTAARSAAPAADGARRIGYLCSYTPVEILEGAGLQPCRIRAPHCAGTDIADTYMGRVTCSYTRCILEAAEEGSYDGLHGIVFTTSCDHMRRLHDNLVYLRSPAFVRNLDLPHKDSAEAIRWYAGEIETLAADLAQAFGVDLGARALQESIRRHNRLRRLMAELDALRAGECVPLNGSECLAVSSGLSMLPLDQAESLLGELLAAAREAAPGRRGRARLILVASQIDNPAYLKALEAPGALVVGEICCTSPSALRGLVDEQAPPFEALATRYLRRTPCPRMMERHQSLIREVEDLFAERRADGVMIVSLKFCDTWGVQGALLTRSLREKGIPVLRMEREYFLSGEGQIATRVQAFMESMGK